VPVLRAPRDKVVDSRESKEGDVIRRRRECLACGKRFTSYERIDQIPTWW
jgi:transcriptional repressor NrdR